jgi:diacylglycerol kinase (ATP)
LQAELPRRRVLIIENPAAGRRRRARRRLARVVAALERGGCRVVLRAGRNAAESERLARDAEPLFDAIVAAGGDGTLNAVANGLAGTARPLALLPLGTANVVAHEIGLPRAPALLAELILRGRARPAWPGRVGERLFLAMASSGFDAETVAAATPRLKRRFGRLAFVWAILRCLWRYRACDILVRADGAQYHASTVIAARARFYAGPFLVAPQAGLGEPALDLVLFRRRGRAAVLRYLAALAFGRLPRRRDIAFLRCREARLSAAAPVAVQADGEIVGALPVALGVAERPLWLIRP